MIVARLPDGSWSAPSAIVTAGAGVGGQIGAELTDFVFVLNTKAAVDTFAQMGSVTLGTNVSIAAGPLGRSAEAAGTATVGSVSAVLLIRKQKGYLLVSLEGSAIVERREANRKFYGSNCKARNILAGQVDIPPACEALMRVLDSRVFSNKLPYDEDDLYNDDYYDDIPDDFSDTTSDSYSSPSRNRRGTVTSSSRSRRRAIPMVIIHLMKINIHLKMIMATLEIEDHQPEVHLQGSAVDGKQPIGKRYIRHEL